MTEYGILGTWRDEIARRLLESGAAMLGFDPPEPRRSAAPRTTDASPSTECICPTLNEMIRNPAVYWSPPPNCPLHEAESMLEFQKNLRLSLLRETNQDQDQSHRSPEAGEV